MLHYTSPRKYDAALVLGVIFVIALQFQITLFQSENYLGLRINLADLLVPFSGIFILVHLLLKKSTWPEWQIKKFYLFITGLGILLLAATLHTHITYGEISRWALINKLSGWVILMGLMGVGGWIGTNISENGIRYVIKTFLYVGVTIAFLEVIAITFLYIPSVNSFVNNFTYTSLPIAGFMANRNAYGLFLLCVLAISTTFYFSSKNIMPDWFYYVLYGLMPFLLVYNGSRATHIATVLFAAIILAIHLKHNVKKFLKLIALVCLGAGLLYTNFAINPSSDYVKLFQTFSPERYAFTEHIKDAESFQTYNQNAINYAGDSMRITILNDAKEMFIKNPVLGSGLGSVFLFQKEKHGEMINLIDCTPLWLLVETGLVGLFAFSAFYIVCAKTLYKGYKCTQNAQTKALQLAILYTMVCFTLMSLFHELMYTRFIWFFLGIGLTLPFRTHHSKQSCQAKI